MSKCVFGLSRQEKRDVAFGSFIVAACLILLFFYGCKDKNTIYPGEGKEFVFVIAVSDSVIKYTYADYYKIDDRKYCQLYDSTGVRVAQLAPSIDTAQLSIIKIDKFNH